MIGMMGNEVDVVVMGTTAAVPQIKAGKVRPLAVLTEPRLPYLPDVPTASEAGIDNYEVLAWNGLLAPAGTPPEIIAPPEFGMGKGRLPARHQGKDTEGRVRTHGGKAR